MKSKLLKLLLFALISTASFATGITDISNIPPNENPDYGDTYPPIKQIRAVSSSEDVIVLDFEGLKNIEYVNGFYNGGTGSKGSQGKNYGIYFTGITWALVGADHGGTGNFVNEPSPVTTLSTNSKNIIINAPKGIKNGISFWYSSSDNLTVTIYDDIDAKGSPLTTSNLKKIEDLNPPGTDNYNIWKPVAIPFNGTAKSIVISNIYNHAVFDNLVLGSSAPVGRTTNNFTISNPVISNVSTRADEFSIWLDISQDDTKPEDLCDERIIKIKDSNGHGATQTGCTKTSLKPTIKNAIRYKFDFKINNIGDKQVYFENATVDLCQKADITMCATLSSIQDFTIYGTHFDMEEDAFSFYNGEYSKALTYDKIYTVEMINDVAVATNVIASFLPKIGSGDIWSAIGYKEDGILFTDETQTTLGLCYGMAMVTTGAFNNKGEKVWGSGNDLGIDGKIWKQQIIDHWDTDKKIATPNTAPLKNTAHYKSSDIEAIKKILYYHAGQNSYLLKGLEYFLFDNNNWVGKDTSYDPQRLPWNGPYQWDYSNTYGRQYIANLLKNGKATIFDFHIDHLVGHAITGVQFISYNNHDKWVLYDNNFPLSRQQKDNNAPFIVYDIEDNRDYDIKSTKHTKNNKLCKINPTNGEFKEFLSWGNSWFWGKYVTISNIRSPLTNTTKEGYTPPDPQNIYKTRAVTTTSTTTPTIDYLLPNHAKVFLVGGKIEKVLDSSGKEVLLKPISQNTLQKGVAYILNDQTVYLPSSNIYKVYAKKVAGFPFLKVFLKIPNSDGTIEIANYENVQTSQADATEVSFYVGEGNTRKNIKRIGESDYKPDFDESFDLQVPPPTLFTGYVYNDEIYLQWQNPDNPNFVKVIITKEAPSTETVYEGTYEFANDQIDYASSLEPVRYSIVSVDQNGNQSEKVYFELDTNKKYISGSVNNANISHMAEPGIEGATITLKNEQGEVIDTTQTNKYGMYVFPNLTNGTYILSVEHPEFAFNDKVVTIDGESPYEFFSEPPKQHLTAYIPSVNTIGEISKIYWDLNLNVASDEQITIKINPDNKGWKTLTTTTKASQGYFEWKVTEPASDNVLVKVRLSSGYDVYDEKVVSVVSPANSVSEKVKNDFNGDGISDIFWRSYAGENHIWLMHEDGSHKYFPKVTKPYEYELVGIGDFNGDGIADVFWRKDTHNYLWLMHKDGSHTHILQADKPKDYLVAGIGDFNGDGRDDILWRNIDGVSLWYMNADGSHKYFRKVNKPLEFRVEGIGDFNGDGIDDIFWKRGKGNYIWFMRADGTHKYMSLVPKPVEYVVAGVGDFNGDGIDDIFWRNDDGTSIWYMNKDGSHKYLRKVNKPLEYKVVKVGDFNGDGIDDIFWRKGSENGLWFMNKNGTHKWKAIKAKPSEFRVYPVYDYDLMQYYQYLWEAYN